MKTNKVMEMAKAFDEQIPDATSENVKAQVKEIGKNAKNTLTCFVATNVCLYKTIESTTELALMIGKTSVKTAYGVTTGWYNSTPAMTVAR